MIRSFYALLFILFVFSISCPAQNTLPFSSSGILKNPLGLKNRSGLGPVIGIEKGRYTFITIGAEIYKSKGLLKPSRITAGFQFQYNFSHNILCYRLYSFYKHGRLGLTYGLGLNYLTDFTSNRFGISPQIGYKLFNFHLYAGGNISWGSDQMKYYNPLFVGLNFFIPTKHHLFKKH